MKYIFILLVLPAFFSNCNIERKLYSPTQVNNPSLKTKKDYSLSLAYGTPSGFDFNAGYAITNRLAVIGGAYTYKNRDQEESYSIFSSQRDSSILVYKHNGFHAGAGFYLPLSKETPSEFVAFFIGYTKGSFEMHEKLYDLSNTPPSPKLNFYKSDLDRWFIQGGFNSYHGIFEFSFITRFNYAGYNNVTTDYDDNQQYSFSLPPNAYPKWSSFLDFSFDTKIFFSKNKVFGLQLFGTGTTRLNRKDFNFYYYPLRLGFGIVLKPPLNNQQLKK
jgi:hypothetical protein